MNDIELRAALTELVKTALHSVEPDLAIQVDPNFEFTQPQQDAWARVTIRDGGQRIAGFGAGAPLWRGLVVVTVDVFVPQNSGDGFAVDACEAVRLAMRAYRSTGLRVVRIEPGAEGLVDGQYRKQQIGIFERDERG